MSGGPKVRPLSFKPKFLIAITTIALSYISLAAPDVQAQWPYTTNKDPSSSVEVGARFFDRPGDDLGVGLAFDPVTNEVLFSSDQATSLDASTGVDLRYNFHGPRTGNKWEFRTLLVNFNSDSQAMGTDINFPLLPQVRPEEIDYTYDSRILSFELNTKRAVFPGLTLLAGCRFISVDEDAIFGFTENIDTIFGPVTVTGGQSIEAINSIYGLQAGFEFNFPICQAIYVSSVGKFGGYNNPTRVVSTTFDSINGPETTEVSKSTGTFVAEIGGRVNYEVIPSCLTTYVGYDAMWIDGIALAPPQFLSTGVSAPLSAVDTTNTPFIQSITVGAQLMY